VLERPELRHSVVPSWYGYTLLRPRRAE